MALGDNFSEISEWGRSNPLKRTQIKLTENYKVPLDWSLFLFPLIVVTMNKSCTLK